jgi:hypothetical protein
MIIKFYYHNIKMTINKLVKIIQNNYTRNLIKMNKINKDNIETMKREIKNINKKINDYDYYRYRINMIDNNLMIVAGVLLMVPYFIKNI